VSPFSKTIVVGVPKTAIRESADEVSPGGIGVTEANNVEATEGNAVCVLTNSAPATGVAVKLLQDVNIAITINNGTIAVPIAFTFASPWCFEQTPNG
jgi:hypothetical protein